MMSRKREYNRIQRHKTVSGTLSVHRNGYGFVTPDAGGDDIFIPARYLRENLHGDRVEVDVEEKSRGGKREGRIRKTLERGVKRITGIFSNRRSGAMLQPADERFPAFLISSASTGGAREGEVVVAEIVSYPRDGHPAVAGIIEVLGAADDPEVEILTVIRKYDLPSIFPPQVLKAAKSIAEIPSESDYSDALRPTSRPRSTSVCRQKTSRCC